MSQKFFPIVTETACRLKWAWSSVRLTNGSTASCHRASPGKLDKNNFQNFHNLPNKIEAREQMLNGQWPEGGCEYCQTIEDAGGQSDRQFQNLIPDVYPRELDTNNTLTSVDPVILEIFFQNTCNLSCLYCTEKYSSSIQKENIKFGGPILLETREKLLENHYDQLSPLLWDWLDKNFHKLYRLHILGGEPLIQNDFERLIDFINDHPNPKLELNVITNLMVKNKNLQNQIEKLESLIKARKVGRIEILASVDSWGPQQEYVRYGFDCDKFDDNFRYLLKSKWIRVGILSTINSLSIPTLPLLVDQYKKWNQQRKIFWHAHLVLPFETHVMSPQAFDFELWKPFLQYAMQNFDEDNFDSVQIKKIFGGIQSTLQKSRPNHDMQKNLISYLDAIDQRRNLNWKNVFPWLVKASENVV
jgi:sulfatase maturation enzyme AslB (radical SAM superfamily)